MKRLTFILTLLMLAVLRLMAVPAKPGPVIVKQPDGSQLSITLHGDEYLHYNTTTDGYTIVKNQQGYYVYAALNEGTLIPTTFVAHDPSARSQAEQDYLQGIARHIAPALEGEKGEQLARERAEEARARQQRRAPGYDYTKMRGLVILVEFNDQEFSRADYKELITDMVNAENYTGFSASDGTKVTCTGSVRDYYRDNSNGLFQPEFDIVGPVKVNRSKYYPGKDGKNTPQLIRDVIDAADEEVNYASYDGNGDKQVDMVYVIFAGVGSNTGGNDERLLWPHASSVISRTGSYYGKDGVVLGRYACSTELGGPEEEPYIDGIGTICHEFTHVLGLPDFYDTDYEESGGESDHPGDFSIMASGCYLNNSRTPCGYTLFERYVMGFATPELIADEGSYNLVSLDVSNTGYRINTSSEKEFFMLENRQRNKWDFYLPAHGLAVYRVDSTNTSVWRNNNVNSNPKHMYFELLRAGGTIRATTFPGTAIRRELSRVTSPALKGWSGAEARLGLTNIQEKNGVITFDAFDTYVLKQLQLPATFEVGKGLQRVLTATAQPSYAEYSLSWSSDNPGVATVDAVGCVTGVSEGTARVTVSSDNGVEATCEVVVEQLTTAETVSAFRQMAADEAAVLMLHDAQVLVVNKKDLYVRDASAALILRNTGLSLTAGDRVEGFVYGKRSDENGMPVLNFVSGKSSQTDLVVSSGGEVEPRHVTIDELTEADYCDLVLVEATHWISDGGVYAVSGDRRMRIFNPFQIKNISVPTDYEGKYYDVTAIFGTNTVKNVGVVEELKLLATPVEVEAPSGITPQLSTVNSQLSTSYNLSGQRVNDGYRGLIIKDGRKVVVH